MGIEGDARVEPLHEGMKASVEFVNLTKTFGNGHKAVDSLSVSFVEQQIVPHSSPEIRSEVCVERLGCQTAFLGHNGAGKTTSLSILTGVFPPTSGTVLVNGLDIRKDFLQIRRFVGLCPQYNVLYDKFSLLLNIFNQMKENLWHRLTVEEHLCLFAVLKGVSKSDIQSTIDSFLEDIDMLPHKNKPSAALSGSIRRQALGVRQWDIGQVG